MDKAGAKQKKESKEEKQKDQKTEDQVLKQLDEETPNATQEEKFAVLLRKHVDGERLAKRSRQEMKTLEKQLETVLREKENLQREYNKSVLMRDKLQEVCREQQKLIKSVKNESIQKIREEEERRKESQSKFQSSLNEITQSLSKNNEENNKLRDHNIEMTKKLKMLAEQYHMREQQLEKLNEQVQLESQLHLAKMNKVQVEAALEKEILIKEKQIALEKFVQSQKMLKELTGREQALKEQLNLYTAKYDDFQSSLQKSNDIFATYKVELEKMAKNSRKLEKETLEWKTKWERSNATLIQLATEKKERDEHAQRCTKQVEQLQKLLRALQNERTHLYKVLRENNVECPPMPALPPEPEALKPAPVSSSSDRDKMDMMTRNCAELKQTLANLQNQMKYLNMSEGATTSKQQQQQQQEETNKKRQKKKQKSKSNKNIKETTPLPEMAAAVEAAIETVTAEAAAQEIAAAEVEVRISEASLSEANKKESELLATEINEANESNVVASSDISVTAAAVAEQLKSELPEVVAVALEAAVDAAAAMLVERNAEQLDEALPADIEMPIAAPEPVQIQSPIENVASN